MKSGGNRITANKTMSSLQTTARPLQSPVFPDYFFWTAKAPPRSLKQPIFSLNPTDFSGSPCSQMSQYERIIETLTTLFTVWVILGTIIGIYKPVMVTWLETDLFTLGLGFLMLSMGLILAFEDFR